MLNHKTLIRLSIVLTLLFVIVGASFAQQNPDSDGDGLPDDIDRCPNEPGPTYTYGCPENSRGDDDNRDDDNRREEPAIPNPPPPDTDGDGTADPQDNCPNLPGNGANYGCPEGQTSEEQPPAPEQPFVLIPIPDDGDCSLASAGNFRVNMRRDPDPESPVIGVLDPNEIVPIGGIFYPIPEIESELEPEGDQRGPWYLPVPDDGGEPGWVAGSVIQTGGADCDDFDLPENRNTGEPYLRFKMTDVLISSYQTGGSSGDGDTDGRDFLIWQRNVGINFPIEIRGLTTTNESGDVVPTDSFSLNFGEIKFEYKAQKEDGTRAAVEIFLKLPDVVGESASTTNPDGSTTIEYCVYLEVQEAGVFEEVCYEIEIPENCTLTSSEAGVYNVECEGDAEIELNPAIDGLPAADITIPEADDDAILIGMLVPAVQN